VFVSVEFYFWVKLLLVSFVEKKLLTLDVLLDFSIISVPCFFLFRASSCVGKMIV
jgi:hypothetical protein